MIESLRKIIARADAFLMRIARPKKLDNTPTKPSMSAQKNHHMSKLAAHHDANPPSKKDFPTRSARLAHMKDSGKEAMSSAKEQVKKAKPRGILAWLRRFFIRAILFFFILLFLTFAVLFIWFASLKAPDFAAFTERKIATSTKIYDRNEVLLYDIHEDIQRTLVEFDQISQHAKDAIIAIEDDQFYNHKGVDVRATFRAVLYTIMAKLDIGDYRVQGGSTITQQVLKNTLLTSERTLSRKMKEAFLAIKLEKALGKDEILLHYLNEAPYGGPLYGIETASQSFFGKPASELTILESAYLAAIPNAPSTFSPYKEDTARLEDRKNLVLRKMKQHGFITANEYDEAINGTVEFRPLTDQYAKAIHFVEYVREYLEIKYGDDVIQFDGLEVITTLDWELQTEMEKIVAKRALENQQAWNASNMSSVAIDPTNGQILGMVGSRGYSDAGIDGKFNVTTALRQPGSSFKPLVYAAGFEEGYTADAILFDVPTQFNSGCTPSDGSDLPCYKPRNYDNAHKGPMTIKNALAQSRNIPAVKMLYLVGIGKATDYAREMGITSLNDPDRYGLTMVLGGGEVSLLQMVSAYGTFANDGVHNAHTPILEVRNKDGEVYEKFEEPESNQVLSEQSARLINDILSDNVARTPLFGSNSFLNFGSTYDVAGKTGTTSENKDAWLVGYAPNLVVGVWSGNNDNTPMTKGSAISGPAWRDIMNAGLTTRDTKRFTPPQPTARDAKPILRGVWQGTGSVVIDTISGKIATEFTPEETRREVVIPDAHTILHWVDRADPAGDAPSNPGADAQYSNWEWGVRNWINSNGYGDASIDYNTLTALINGADQSNPESLLGIIDDVHTPQTQPTIDISNPDDDDIISANSTINLEISAETSFPVSYVDYYLGDVLIGRSGFGNFSYSFRPDQNQAYRDNRSNYEIKAVLVDEVFNRAVDTVRVTIE